MEEKKTVQTEVEKPRDRAVLAGLSSPRLDKRDNADEDTLEELGALVETAGGEVAAVVLQNRAAPEPRTFIGEGKVAEIRELVRNDLVKNYLWGKLFKRRLFDGISFPVGRTYEDVAVLYKVFYNSQKVVLSCVSKYHYMIHQNESITRGSYDPVKEYHFFLSLYEQDCFLRQAAKFGNESGINALKRGIHLVNHTFLCPDSPAYEEILARLKKITE